MVAAAILPVAEAAVLSAGSEELVVAASAQLGAGGHTSELSVQVGHHRGRAFSFRLCLLASAIMSAAEAVSVMV